MNTATEEAIALKVRDYVRGALNLHVLSTGERIAVALVVNDMSLQDFGTVAQAIKRLGPRWFEAALNVQQRGVDHYLKHYPVTS